MSILIQAQRRMVISAMSASKCRHSSLIVCTNKTLILAQKVFLQRISFSKVVCLLYTPTLHGRCSTGLFVSLLTM